MLVRSFHLILQIPQSLPGLVLMAPILALPPDPTRGPKVTPKPHAGVGGRASATLFFRSEFASPLYRILATSLTTPLDVQIGIANCMI